LRSSIDVRVLYSAARVFRGRTVIANRLLLSAIPVFGILFAVDYVVDSSATAPTNATAPGVFEPARCPVPVPDGLVEGQSMVCGYVSVPERHAKPDSPTVRLAVARFPRLSKSPDPDPIVLLAGGPGESNFEAFVPGMGSAAGGQFRAKHDIVLIELRGLLYSQPSLACPERFAEQEAQLAVNPGDAAEIEADLTAIRACHDRLVAQRIDLAAFNNAESAADIALVMTALGYDRFELYANSAGTLLAQHAMRAYPRRLKAVVLGSVVPLTAATWPAMPANGTRALRRVFEHCAAQSLCSRSYPTVEADFVALVDRLNRGPVTVQLEDPVREAPIKLLLTGDRVAQWIYNLLLMDANAGHSIPFLIDRLAAGEIRALQFGIGSFLPARTLSQGLQYSIACAEQRGFSAAAIDTSGPYQAFARAVARLSFGPERLLAACRIWDVPNLDPSANAVVGDTPTLLLAGEFDPATPPSYAQIVARTLTAARVFTLPGVAHTPIDGGPCPMSLALAFMDDPTRVPDDGCVSKMKVRFVVEPIAERFLWPSVPSVAMLAICLSVMVSVPVGWAIVAWRDRRSPSEAPLRARRAKRCAVAAVGLNLTFVVIVLAANPMEIVYGYPISLRAAMILPLLSLLPISGAVWYALPALRGADRHVAPLLPVLLLTLALLIWLWQLNYWYLLPWPH
jgi:pimeloyl-ACP methyl ester carboxylesterase